MNRLARLWDLLWFQRVDPFSMAIFRISLGGLLVPYWLATGLHWERFFGADGVASLNDPMNRLVRPEDSWSVFQWTEGLVPLDAYWWLGLAAVVAFLLGFWTRLATIVLFVLICSMIHRNRLITNGEDLVFRMLLFYAVFSPLHQNLSLDAWLHRRRVARGAAQPWGLPQVWPIRMMQWNVLLIYVISLYYKLGDPDPAWLTGEAIYWCMANSSWYRGWHPELGYMWGGIFSTILTYGTIFAEAQFPLLVWFDRSRLFSLALITLLHLGIAIFVPNVTFFTLSMICSFWIFVPGEQCRSWFIRRPDSAALVSGPVPANDSHV